MADVKINVGMLAATCALCATEAAVDSPAYENVLSATVCTVCASFGLYLTYKNVKVAIAKTKGPIKGSLRKAQEKLPSN